MKRLLLVWVLPFGLLWVVGGSIALMAWGPDHIRRMSGNPDPELGCLTCHQLAGGWSTRQPEGRACGRCHSGVPGGAGDRVEDRPEPPPSIRYLSPVALAFAPGGDRLYVVCHGSDEVLALDPASGQVLARTTVGAWPFGIAVHPQPGGPIYVSNRRADSVSILDAETLALERTVPVGRQPCGLATDAAGETLYVANAGSDDVSVIELPQGREIKRLVAGREPFAVATAPGGGPVVVANRLSRPLPATPQARTDLPWPDRPGLASEVTLIDPARRQVRARRALRGAHLLEGLAFTPDGRWAIVSLVRPRNLVPATQLGRGWMMSSGVGFLELGGARRTAQLLTDEPHAAFADPSGVAVSGQRAWIAAGGADVINELDLGAALMRIEATPAAERERLGDHLGVAAEIVRARLPTGANPRAVVASPDGRRIYVADRLSDTITVIDAAGGQVIDTFNLGGPSVISQVRRGERIFHDGRVTFQGQFSCRSCHPEGHLDGLTYDLGVDGLGQNILDNRSLLGLHGTAPFKWNGKNKTLADQCGRRFAKFLSRAAPIAGEDLEALVAFIDALPAPPPPAPPEDPEQAQAQARGRVIFERGRTNDGRVIPPGERCPGCHGGPRFTNRALADVKTQAVSDTVGRFDNAHLRNVAGTAPYLHDGRAATLEAIWTVYSPNDEHGVTRDLRKDQLNDLVAYLRSI